MQHRLLLGAVLAFAGVVSAAPSQSHLSLSFTKSESDSLVRAELRGATGPRFAIQTTLDPHSRGQVHYVAGGVLDAQGEGKTSFTGPAPQSLTKNQKLWFRAVYLSEFGREYTQWMPLGLNPACEQLNFNYGGDSMALPAGMIIDEQWATQGIHISCVGNAANTPNEVIIFDSGNPTGGDTDLVTPGYGPGNDTALGNLLIIADNVTDNVAPFGLVDAPNDSGAGGTITFDFDRPFTLCSLGLVDLDEGGIGSVIRFFGEANAMLGELDLPSPGDNSFTEVGFLFEGVYRVEIEFTGSGAIPFLGLIPCPFDINIDTNSLGLPNDLLAGMEITDQFDNLGVSVYAQNGTPGHPNKVIVFDTANPTGEDPDLATPGYGPGNTEEQGLVLIIAEDDVDAGNDGRVDDPDDEGGGGTLTFEFEFPVIFESATVLDIDAGENSFLVLYTDKQQGDNEAVFGGQVVLPLAPLGDNSSQTIEEVVGGVWRIDLVLSGSGALARLRACPDELLPPPPVN